MESFLAFSADHPFIVSSAVLLTLVALYNEFRLASRRGVDLPPGAAIGLINAGAAVIDLRTFERFRAGHIINAKHVPAEDLGEAASGKLASLKDGTVIVYCDAGVSGARAASLLRRLGFANAVNLRGGIAAWERENLPLETRA